MTGVYCTAGGERSLCRLIPARLRNRLANSLDGRLLNDTKHPHMARYSALMPAPTQPPLRIWHLELTGPITRPLHICLAPASPMRRSQSIE